MTDVSQAMRGALVPRLPHIQPCICTLVVSVSALSSQPTEQGLYRRAID